MTWGLRRCRNYAAPAPRSSLDFFLKGQGLPQGSASYVLLLHLVATNFLED